MSLHELTFRMALGAPSRDEIADTVTQKQENNWEKMASKQEATDQNSKISTDCPTLGSEASKTVLDEAVDALEFIPGRPMMPNAR